MQRSLEFGATAAALRANTRAVEEVLANDIGAGGGRYVRKEECTPVGRCRLEPVFAHTD
jgi:hypothetical protein